MKTTLKKLSPVVLRLLSAACVLAMLIGMALPVWASPSDSKWEDKIEPQLRDIMNQMEDNEVVAVYLFLDSTQIMADIEAEKQALGTDYETLLAFLETQVELGVLPFYDGVDIYDATIMSHRAIVKRHMSAANEEFVAQYVNADRNILYQSQYTSTLIVDAIKAEIIAYAQLPDVNDIAYYDDLSETPDVEPPMEPYPQIKGDINGDGLVSIKDIMLARDIIFGKRELDSYEVWAADMNEDGVVDIIDVLLIRDIIFGLDANDLLPKPMKFHLTIIAGPGGIIPAGWDKPEAMEIKPDGTFSGLFKAGETLDIEAMGVPGYHFVKWTSSNGGIFVAERCEKTAFMMPWNDVEITANYLVNEAPS